MDYNERNQLLCNVASLNNEIDLVDDLKAINYTVDTRFKLRYIRNQKKQLKHRLQQKRKLIDISLKLLEIGNNG